jgi:hypothetical protein
MKILYLVLLLLTTNVYANDNDNPFYIHRTIGSKQVWNPASKQWPEEANRGIIHSRQLINIPVIAEEFLSEKPSLERRLADKGKDFERLVDLLFQEDGFFTEVDVRKQIIDFLVEYKQLIKEQEEFVMKKIEDDYSHPLFAETKPKKQTEKREQFSKVFKYFEELENIDWGYMIRIRDISKNFKRHSRIAFW